MPCYPFKTSDGATGIICTRGNHPSKCKFCGAACTKECDYPTAKRSGTCDAKTCDKCATSGGPELDYCPDHAPFVFPVAGHRIFVVNVRSAPEDAIYIGREMPKHQASPLGNPFKPADPNNNDDRDLCLRNYRQWLWGQIKVDGPVLAELTRLAEQVRIVDVLLACWCVPSTCHGQIVAKAIKWLCESTEPAPARI